MNEPSEAKLHFLDYWRVIRVRSSIALLVFLLVMVTTGIYVYLAPRIYIARVTMEVKPDEARVHIFSDAPMQGSSDPSFAPTQFEILKTTEILYPVIDQIKLQERWGYNGVPLLREWTLGKLKRIMNVSEVRGTNLLEIAVKSPDPAEAAEIANTIAMVYKERRVADQDESVSRGLGQLKEEVDKQREKVQDTSLLMGTIRGQDGVIDLNPESMETSDIPENRQVLGDESQVQDAKVKLQQLKTQLAQIEKLKPEELLVALHTLEIDDPTVTKVLPLYQDAVAEEARLLNSGLGENHPRVKALRAQKAVYAEQLDEQLRALRDALARKVTLHENTLGALQNQLGQSRSNFQGIKNKSAAYTEAKNKYINAKRVLEASETRYYTARMQQNITITPAKIWQPAEPPSMPSEPKVWLYMLVAAAVGAGLGGGLAFFLEYLDTSVKSLDEVERLLNLPVLAVIPRKIPLLHRCEGDAPDAEAYRILRTNIEFNRKSPDASTLTVVSGGPGEGKSTTLCNLAFTCAKGGYNVLLVDADLRRPSQDKFFGVENTAGLTDYLTGRMDFDEIVRPTGVENLSILPSGILPHDSVGILNSQRMSELIQHAKAAYDLVLFDSPPILGVSDGSVLASEVDLVIMVVQHRRFPRSMLLRVKSAVANVGGNLLGVVLNNVNVSHDQHYQYYTNYQQYYKTPRKPEPARAGAAHSEDY